MLLSSGKFVAVSAVCPYRPDRAYKCRPPRSRRQGRPRAKFDSTVLDLFTRGAYVRQGQISPSGRSRARPPMFQKNTTFVIGAGASAELGFPTGWQLTEKIAEKLGRAGSYSLTDQRLSEAIVHFVNQSLPPGTLRADRDTAIANYFNAAAQMREAMPLAPSIDSYMDGLRSDGRIQACGRLGIIRCVTEAEEHRLR